MGTTTREHHAQAGHGIFTAADKLVRRHTHSDRDEHLPAGHRPGGHRHAGRQQRALRHSSRGQQQDRHGIAGLDGSDAGNYALTSASANTTASILFAWNGFLQPINDTAHQTGVAQSKFKLGQTIPVKFVIKNAFGNVVQQASKPQFSQVRRGALRLGH